MRRFVFLLGVIAACHKHEADADDRAKREGERPVYTPSRTPPEEAIHAYESASSCDARGQTIAYPTENRDLIAKQRCFTRHVEDVNVKECNALAGGATQCHATAERDGDKKRYWLVKLPNGNFAVDFRATERPLSLYDYRLYQPKTATGGRARARRPCASGKRVVDAHVEYVVAELTEIGGDLGAKVLAYVARDSPDGKALLADIDARSDTEVTLALSAPTNESPATALVTKYFGTELFESDAENVYEALVRDGGT